MIRQTFEIQKDIDTITQELQRASAMTEEAVCVYANVDYKDEYLNALYEELNSLNEEYNDAYEEEATGGHRNWSKLDPAFASWEEVNEMFISKTK